MAERAFISRFSPNRTAPQVLEAIFVQRHKLAETWLKRLRDSVLTKTRHHLLAVGPRGCGKSHLVNLLLHRLQQDKAINARVRIAWLPEDEASTSFWKFLLRILRALKSQYGDEFPDPPRAQLEVADDEQRANILIAYLLKKLARRTLLVVVENLDDVMQGLKDDGQKRWRAFLQEHPVVATLATAQQLTDDIIKRDRPFFNFFQVEHLQPLSADEAMTLLQRIGQHTGKADLVTFLQTPRGRARVRAIRHITGGSHRVFIILSEFATQENLDNLVAAFEELLDELTPYYQERLRWLADQQREIVEFLCRQTRTVPVKEIAAELFLSEQAAAAQLKALRDKGYVKVGSVGRESRYELAEPLMRMCVEVKDPRREPIRLIVDFICVWYDPAVVEARLECLPDCAEVERRYLRAAQRLQLLENRNRVEEILDADLVAARATGEPDQVAQVLVELAATAGTAQRCVAAGNELLYVLNRYIEALSAHERAIELDSHDAEAWLGKGTALERLARYAEALAVFEKMLAMNPQDVAAWTGKAWNLGMLDRFVEALAAYDRVIELDPNNVFAWESRGATLRDLGQFSEAITACDRAIELDPNDRYAWHYKGSALEKTGRFVEALAAHERAIELEPKYALGWNGMGRALEKLGRLEEALVAHERAFKLAPEQTSACGHLAHVLEQLGRFQEALAKYERVIQIDPKFLVAWIKTASLLNRLGRYSEALLSSARAIEIDATNVSAWSNRGRTNLGLGEIKIAVKDFRLAIQFDATHTDSIEGLAEAYITEGNWDEAEQTLSKRFALSPSAPNPSPSEHLPDVLAAIFRVSADRAVWVQRVSRLAEIAAAASALNQVSDALVRSLTRQAYVQASAETLHAWAGVWNEIAQRHPDLSVAARLFSVGVRYLRDKDERVLLDLLQEERTILRDLFGLSPEAEH